MTKGQETFDKWVDTDVPPGMTSQEQLFAMIDAAIAEAVRARTVECAEALVRTGYEGSMIHRFILDMNKPPVPPYPFEKPCQCWRPDEPGSKVWRHDLPEPSNYVLLPIYDNNCRYCGSKRITKGN